MRIIHFTLLLVLTIVFNSCYSYKVYPKEFRKIENEQPKKKAFVLNDSLKKEFKILSSSELFNIVKDSSEASVTIRLYPIEQSFVCGQPLTFSMLTLGQFPVILPDRYFFQFDEIENDQTINRKFELKVAQRMWFWDMFVFKKRFEHKAGKALLGEYLSSGN